MSQLRLAGLIVPIAFLLGCASAPKAQPPPMAQPASTEHVVTGVGTTDDRKVVNHSSQQVYETVHQNSPDTAAPNQGIP